MTGTTSVKQPEAHKKKAQLQGTKPSWAIKATIEEPACGAGRNNEHEDQQSLSVRLSPRPQERPKRMHYNDITLAKTQEALVFIRDLYLGLLGGTGAGLFVI
jgi:hypothetical protein